MDDLPGGLRGDPGRDRAGQRRVAVLYARRLGRRVGQRPAQARAHGLALLVHAQEDRAGSVVRVERPVLARLVDHSARYTPLLDEVGPDLGIDKR